MNSQNENADTDITDIDSLEEITNLLSSAQLTNVELEGAIKDLEFDVQDKKRIVQQLTMEVKHRKSILEKTKELSDLTSKNCESVCEMKKRLWRSEMELIQLRREKREEELIEKRKLTIRMETLYNRVKKRTDNTVEGKLLAAKQAERKKLQITHDALTIVQQYVIKQKDIEKERLAKHLKIKVNQLPKDTAALNRMIAETKAEKESVLNQTPGEETKKNIITPLAKCFINFEISFDGDHEKPQCSQNYIKLSQKSLIMKSLIENDSKQLPVSQKPMIKTVRFNDEIMSQSFESIQEPIETQTSEMDKINQDIIQLPSGNETSSEDVDTPPPAKIQILENLLIVPAKIHQMVSKPEGKTIQTETIIAAQPFNDSQQPNESIAGIIKTAKITAAQPLNDSQQYNESIAGIIKTAKITAAQPLNDSQQHNESIAGIIKRAKITATQPLNDSQQPNRSIELSMTMDNIMNLLDTTTTHDESVHELNLSADKNNLDETMADCDNFDFFKTDPEKDGASDFFTQADDNKRNCPFF